MDAGVSMAKRPKLILQGRGGWASDAPLVFELVDGPQGYLWIGRVDDAGEERYVASISPAMARRLANFLNKALDG